MSAGSFHTTLCYAFSIPSLPGTGKLLRIFTTYPQRGSRFLGYYRERSWANETERSDCDPTLTDSSIAHVRYKTHLTCLELDISTVTAFYMISRHLSLYSFLSGLLGYWRPLSGTFIKKKCKRKRNLIPQTSQNTTWCSISKHLRDELAFIISYNPKLFYRMKTDLPFQY